MAVPTALAGRARARCVVTGTCGRVTRFATAVLEARDLREPVTGVNRREPGLWRELPLGHERVHARGELDVAHPCGGHFRHGEHDVELGTRRLYTR